MAENKLATNSPLDLLKSLDSDDDDEEIDESFLCCVCLDLLYKPIVLACGHISCFWCVHKTMNNVGESNCPICRCPYRHFPSVCQLLHFLLLKMYPVAYKKRGKQVLEEEQREGVFSPQLVNNLLSSNTYKELNVLDPLCTSSTICTPMEDMAHYSGTCSSGEINTSTTMEQRISDLLICETKSAISGESHACLEATKLLDMEENNLKDGTCECISVDDVSCVACKQLLFQPSVLNCGHVYCQSCIGSIVNEALRCQLCQSIHPKGSLKVCLELDHLLEKRFPNEYALRRDIVKLQTVHDTEGQSGNAHKQSSSLADHGLNVHFGVGCDYCGIYPIVGQRYKCLDCLEIIGFDLCGDCYNTHSKLPGRFNQNHKSEHKFELVNANLLHNIMVRINEQAEGNAVPVHFDDALDDVEDILPFQVLTDDDDDDLGNQEGDDHLTTA